MIHPGVHARRTSMAPSERPKASRFCAVAAGLAGGVAMNATMLLTFRLLGFGLHGDGILLDARIQSPKLIAVWTRLEPLPLVVNHPAPIILGLMLLGIVHGFVYRWLAPAWPSGIMARGWRFALLIYLTYCFWEFFTPFNQFGEPLPLIALELLFWFMIAVAEALAIAATFETWPAVA